MGDALRFGDAPEAVAPQARRGGARHRAVLTSMQEHGLAGRARRHRRGLEAQGNEWRGKAGAPRLRLATIHIATQARRGPLGGASQGNAGYAPLGAGRRGTATLDRRGSVTRRDDTIGMAGNA